MFMMEFSSEFWSKAKPYLGVVFMQFGFAGMSIVSKLALDQGLSPHVFVVYRHIVATLVMAPFAIVFDRKVRPKMTFPIFMKIVLLGLLEPTIDQNLFYTGMKYTTATFSSAMCNILPAFAFLLAWACRLEKVKVKELRGQAKIVGTIVTMGGAMLMTLYKGTKLGVPWTKGHVQHTSSTHLTIKQDPIKGALMMSAGSICWASFIILQAITLKSYPAEFSLTVLICLVGAIEGTVFAIGMEWGNSLAWAIHLDAKLLATVYSGVICSGIYYYVQGVVMKDKGPVFVTAFNPLSMIITTIMGSILLSETMYLGRIMGAIVIVGGLYLVLWGKSKDQPQSDFNNNKEAPRGPIETVNQGQVTIDLSKVTPTDESNEGIHYCNAQNNSI